jgi:hypothetical protein
MCVATQSWVKREYRRWLSTYLCGALECPGVYVIEDSFRGFSDLRKDYISLFPVVGIKTYLMQGQNAKYENMQFKLRITAQLL